MHTPGNIYRNWFLASRPWSFTMSAISVSVGAIMGAFDGRFSWGFYLLTLAGIVLLHAGANLMNDYCDVTRGVDTREVSTAHYRPHPLVEGALTPEAVRFVSLALFGVAGLIGIVLAATRGWPILVIGFLGTLGALTYTAPPLGYKYKALGEPAVGIMWGPLMVEGAYYVQRQTLSIEALWVSIPFGVLVALVLLANNIRDIDHDRPKGISTLPILLGREGALLLYLFMVVLAYGGIIVMAAFGPLGPWSFMVLLSLPVALRLIKEMERGVPADADARTAQIDTAFGVLLVVSMVLEVLW